MPQLLSDIVREVIARQPNIAVVGEVDATEELGQAVWETGADVLICRRPGPELPDIFRQLFETHPHVAVLAIDEGDRTGSAYQLRATQSPLDVRPQGLIDAIRTVGRSRPFSWATGPDDT
jgi:DNA-binding NarL/FixJ family response regulator